VFLPVEAIGKKLFYATTAELAGRQGNIVDDQELRLNVRGSRPKVGRWGVFGLQDPTIFEGIQHVLFQYF
jgi:hypothetical protein